MQYVYVVTGSAGPLRWDSAAVIWRGLSDAGISGNEPAPFSQEEYRVALANLLPQGPAWSRDPESTQQGLLRALAAEFERLDQRMVSLLAEVAPVTVSELLDDWERVAGLPDPCVTTAQTIGERRRALSARLNWIGGASPALFISIASALGYTITIEEFHSAAEATAAGIVFTGDEWAHIWRVNVTESVAVVPFRVGAGRAGEPLRSWSNEVIECQFNRLKPAHTRVLFAYDV